MYPYAEIYASIYRKVLHTNIQNINHCLLAYLEMYSVYGLAVQQVTVMHSSSIQHLFLVILQSIGIIVIEVKKQGWLSTPADFLGQVLSFALVFHISAIL